MFFPEGFPAGAPPPPPPSSGARPSSASCATSEPSWEDPLADQEDTGHDPWGACSAFEDDDNCFCGD